jgi:hypothetical protein
MELRYRAPEGMNDVLPEQSARWQYVEARWRDHCHCYGYGEIRTPILESAALFERSVGETSDIVSKEMYVLERGDERYALKPEGTAPVVRAYLEHSLYAGGRGAEAVLHHALLPRRATAEGALPPGAPVRRGDSRRGAPAGGRLSCWRW